MKKAILFLVVLCLSLVIDLAAAEPTQDVPTLTMQTNIIRGDFLTIGIQGIDGADHYELNVYWNKPNQSWPVNMFYQTFYALRSFTIPTIEWTPGTYTASVRAVTSDGNAVFSDDYPFTLVEPENGLGDEPFFRADRTEVQTQEQYSFSIYAPGASKVILKEKNRYANFNQNGEILGKTVKQNYPDTYEYVAYATYPDQTDPVQIGEPIYISVSAPLGLMNIEFDVPATVPITGEPDQYMEFSINYHLQNMLYGPDVTVGYQKNYQTNNVPFEVVSQTQTEDGCIFHYRVPLSGLSAGTYQIHVYIEPDQTGYMRPDITQEFALIDLPVQEGSLSISPDTINQGESYWVDIDIPGATAFWLHLGAGGFVPLIGNPVHYEVSENVNVGNKPIYALYTTEEGNWNPQYIYTYNWNQVAWTGATNAETIRIGSRGVLQKPNYTLSTDKPHRGEAVNVTINELQGKNECYKAMFRNDSQSWSVAYDAHEWNEDTRQIEVPTALLEPGRYTLKIFVEAEGYERYEHCCSIDILPMASHEAVITPATGTIVKTGEDVELNVCAEDSTSITADVRWIENPDYQYNLSPVISDDAYYASFPTPNRPGTLRAEIQITYSDGTVQTEQVDIEVTAPYGEAPIPVLVMDKPWVQGETLCFTLQPAEDAGEEPISYVGIWVNAVSHGSDPTRSVINEDCNGDHAIWNRTFTADGNTIPQDCDYYLQIVVSGIGYSFASYSTQLYPANGEQLRLPEELTEIGSEAFRNTDAQWIVIPATCTSIGGNAFAGCTNLRYLTVEGENTVLSAEAFGDTDLNIIYGKSGSKAQKFAADNGILFYAVR